MKNAADAIIHTDQASYLSTLLPHSDPLLAEMETYSSDHNVPSSDPEVALFLAITAQAMRAKSALEVGTAIGYGAIVLARAMGADSMVTTIDPSDERIATAQQFIQRAGMESRITIRKGKELDVIPQLEGPFDLAYLDAVKEEYPDYLEAILPRLRIGGVVLADNVLWKGQVAGKLLSPDQAESTAALREFNRILTTHPKLNSIVLPLGDGLAYGIKIAN
jgi:caffeoyl-CoA O-methyltransferase